MPRGAAATEAGTTEETSSLMQDADVERADEDIGSGPLDSALGESSTVGKFNVVVHGVAFMVLFSAFQTASEVGSAAHLGICPGRRVSSPGQTASPFLSYDRCALHPAVLAAHSGGPGLLEPGFSLHRRWASSTSRAVPLLPPLLRDALTWCPHAARSTARTLAPLHRRCAALVSLL